MCFSLRSLYYSGSDSVHSVLLSILRFRYFLVKKINGHNSRPDQPFFFEKFGNFHFLLSATIIPSTRSIIHTRTLRYKEKDIKDSTYFTSSIIRYRSSVFLKSIQSIVHSLLQFTVDLFY